MKCIFFFPCYTQEEDGLEINDWLSNGEISLHCPWQVKELGRDKFEHLVHINVVRCARKEERGIEGLGI